MLRAGDRFGPYVVVAPLGAGGMGEVYQANDTRLHRAVALKVLSKHMHQREDARHRFQREASAISKLNHPHICTLYDIGQENGTDYLVMEWLEGETLESRLKRAHLPLTDVLRIGCQIANALDRAHRSEIVHRDLKPGNIMLTKHGAKLLDFGLAKSYQASFSNDHSNSQALTEEGMIFGTLPYMSPEQLEGQPADTRSDIFAFGSVMFEMLTCRRAFVGASQASLIAAIMNADVAAIDKLDARVPPTFKGILKTCLAKEPENRWQSIRDVSIQLELLAASTNSFDDKQRPMARRVQLVAGGLLLGIVLGLLPWFLHHRERTSPLVQTSITAPDGSEFSGLGSAISPDGRNVAFVATTKGKERLWLRPLSARDARVLEDTDEAQFPFWAPDSRSIGFFSHGTVKRFDMDGIGVRTIAVAANGRGGSWSQNGTIVFSPNLSSRLWRVAATGGVPVPATNLDAAHQDVRHNFPQFLPDGRHFLFLSHSADPQKSGPKIGTLDDPAHIEPISELAGNTFQAIHAPLGNSDSGQLIFVKERVLVAQGFNTHKLRLEGEPHTILSRKSFNVASSPGFLNLTASSTGTLLDGGAQRARNELIWRSRDGTGSQVVGEENDYITPRISPDGSRIAVTKADAASGDYDLWMLNVKQKAASRFTFTAGLDFYPVWTPKGANIVYASEAAGRLSLFSRTLGGLSEARQLLKNTGPNPYPYDISEDNKFLLFDQIGESNRGDIWVLPLAKQAPPFVFLGTSSAELHPHFSPGSQNGKWIVYTSDESGVDQVYVRRFSGGPAAETKWQISSDGGRFPLWRGNGSEVVYLAPDGKLMAAPIRFSENTIESGLPKPLFDAGLPATPFSRYPYDLSADGKTFLLLNATREHPADTLNILLNWTELLKR